MTELAAPPRSDRATTLRQLERADEQRRAGLRRMRIVATSLLVLAAIIYALTHEAGGLLGYVNAAAEASMVGAMADWFAVTALFRRPLGLPIPHTALVPERKDAVAVSLEEFFTAHFLTGDAVRERYYDAEVSKRLGAWLAGERHAQRVVQETSRIARRVIGRVRDDEIEAVLRAVVLPRLEREPISPLAGTMLEQMVEDGAHHGLIDLIADEVVGWLEENPATFESILAERAPTWAPQWLSVIVTDRAYEEALDWACAIRDDPGHRVRRALTDLLADLAQNLQFDPVTRERAEAVKQRWLEHPQTLRTAMALWLLARETLDESLGDPDGHVRTRLVEEVMRLGERIRDDEQLRARIDQDVGDGVAFMVESYASELAPVITQVISRWDGREASERIELHVGRDLQFIRINGTIVGGLVGVIIHALSQLA